LKIPISQRLAAPRDRVFAALTDPALLQRCIDGCEKMTSTGDDAYDVDLKVGVAGMKGSYKGKVKLSAKQPPESLTLAVEGKGMPGFVRGNASLRFAEVDGGTEITGEGDVTVGGLIAAVGSRLIEGAAKKMMADFFGRVAAQLATSGS
jgi:carbon monoxide dehydrogenase subunit G